jgi:purine-binding chemotaxis protein CheW
MGRMAEARKRARKTAGSGGKRSNEAARAAPAGEPEAAAGAGAETLLPAKALEWESREEPLVFPAEAPGEAGDARLALPSSGLASEILAREDALRRAGAPAPEASDPPTALEPVSPPSAVSFFTTASSREEKKAVEATEHLATFLLDSEEYGVDVRLVQEIIRVAEITPVPRAPEFIRGVINLRGRIIPVVDLKNKLGLGGFAAQRSSRIVVVKLRERLMGLLVDAASQVLKVPVSVIEAAPEEVVEIDQSFIRGVAKLERRLIILLDLARVLAIELREVKGE